MAVAVAAGGGVGECVSSLLEPLGTGTNELLLLLPFPGIDTRTAVAIAA